jgi:hypothetical protein
MVDGVPATVAWARVRETKKKENVMLKTMTASIAFAALLFGAASTPFAAVRTHTQNDPAERQATMLVWNPVAVGASNMKCSIPGLYHDEPYCFGSEATGRTRISGAIPTTSGY